MFEDLFSKTQKTTKAPKARATIVEKNASRLIVLSVQIIAPAKPINDIASTCFTMEKD